MIFRCSVIKLKSAEVRRVPGKTPTRTPLLTERKPFGQLKALFGFRRGLDRKSGVSGDVGWVWKQDPLHLHRARAHGDPHSVELIDQTARVLPVGLLLASISQADRRHP